MHNESIVPRHRSLIALPASLSACFLLLASCSQSSTKPDAAPHRAEISETRNASARVESVDQARRTLVLKNEKGDTMRVLAGPEVRNFAQISAGDTVRVAYQASLAVELKKPDETSPALTIDAAAGRAAPGSAPAAAAGAAVTMTVRIESVDLERNIVVVEPPGGGLEAIDVKRPEGREFIRGLKPGDRVQITYTEAVALRVDKN